MTLINVQELFIRKRNLLIKIYKKLNMMYSQVNLLREFGASTSFMFGALIYCMVPLVLDNWLVYSKNLYSTHFV
jgi:hypothetical protein